MARPINMLGMVALVRAEKERAPMDERPIMWCDTCDRCTRWRQTACAGCDAIRYVCTGDPGGIECGSIRKPVKMLYNHQGPDRAGCARDILPENRPHILQREAEENARRAKRRAAAMRKRTPDRRGP